MISNECDIVATLGLRTTNNALGPTSTVGDPSRATAFDPDGNAAAPLPRDHAWACFTRAESQRQALRGQEGDAAPVVADYRAALHELRELTREQAARAWAGLGELSFRQNRFNDAVVAYTCALDSQCLSAELEIWVQLSRSEARRRIGDRRGALDDCAKVLCTLSEDVIAWSRFCCGEAPNLTGDYGTAIADRTALLDDGLLSYEDTALVHFNRGLCHRMMSDQANAIADFDAALRFKEGVLAPVTPTLEREVGRLFEAPSLIDEARRAPQAAFDLGVQRRMIGNELTPAVSARGACSAPDMDESNRGDIGHTLIRDGSLPEPAAGENTPHAELSLSVHEQSDHVQTYPQPLANEQRPSEPQTALTRTRHDSKPRITQALMQPAARAPIRPVAARCIIS